MDNCPIRYQTKYFIKRVVNVRQGLAEKSALWGISLKNLGRPRYIFYNDEFNSSIYFQIGAINVYKFSESSLIELETVCSL